MKRKSTFRIGELSKLFNIGVDSIRYYESVGILSPIRDPQSNYRIYTVADVRKLTMIRELLNLNFSTDQIREFSQNHNISNTMSLLSSELTMVNSRIKELQETKSSIEARLHSFEENLAKDSFETVRLLELKARPCLMISDSNLPDVYVDYYLVKYMHSQNHKVDTIGACDCYTLDPKNSDPNSDYYRTKNVFFYSSTLPYHSNSVLPAGKYLSLTYRGSLKKTKKLVPQLYAYAEEHDLTVVGDPMEFCLIDDYETDDENEYLTEIQLAVI